MASESASELQTEEEDVFDVDKPRQDVPRDDGVDEAKLKEMKKEEERENQRHALERKKLQEKAAAKAAVRAQKEAEKKQKEREKKLKKKEAMSKITTNEESQPTMKWLEEAEPDISDNVEQVNETSAPGLAKDQKETALRHRRTTKSQGGYPKATPRNKKCHQLLDLGSSCGGCDASRSWVYLSAMTKRELTKSAKLGCWGNVTVDVNS